MLQNNNLETHQTTSGEQELNGVVREVTEIYRANGSYFQVKCNVFESVVAKDNNAMPLKIETIELHPDDLLPFFAETIAKKKNYENLDVTEHEWHTVDSDGNPIDLELRKIRMIIPLQSLPIICAKQNGLISQMLANGVPFVINHVVIWSYFESLVSATPEEITALESLGVIIQYR